jgi:hypothetical protein
MRTRVQRTWWCMYACTVMYTFYAHIHICIRKHRDTHICCRYGCIKCGMHTEAAVDRRYVLNSLQALYTHIRTYTHTHTSVADMDSLNAACIHKWLSIDATSTTALNSLHALFKKKEVPPAKYLSCLLAALDYGRYVYTCFICIYRAYYTCFRCIYTYTYVCINLT